ncbi:urea ABC transporter permease subunit UrtB [Alkalilimnicola ehrlichii MLHE-1]|uniref:Amino acid/amide ABC transporter membrane protein 1, HAAT family n=1 Tax=Alkalilimnicola ehrlichii (strain ATCC BAA-1101 / DSM 17681 / MLHE-1) TaxID=187272 RepID=Q0AC93_ALKEH|nr:urea ABC transporter permease subunit UrtB [Alkalilimnicola ehrlichii]ABI55544.1 amino acid/amide ABC transporter membrane protein 1, HAAT family [Alkalilimnicola ehrlichii MLHE-1]
MKAFMRWALAVVLCAAAASALADQELTAEERAAQLAETEADTVEVAGDGLAEETAEAVARMASSNWQDVRDAINRLAELNDADALPVLQALQDRRLFYDQDERVLVEDALTGQLRDPVTGEDVEREGLDLSEPPLTNPIRRSLRPVIGQLQIFSDELPLRLSAAEELADRPQAAMLDTLREAVEQEQNAEVSRLLNIAIARLELDDDDAEVRLAAVETIAVVRSSRLKSQLQRLLAEGPDGEYIEPDERVREAARVAIEAIEARERVASVLSDLVYGLSMGSVLLLAALGLAIIFGLMRVINMAHGELLMIGAYVTFLVQNFFVAFMPGLFNFYLVAAVPVAFIATALVGIAMERGVIRFLYKRPLETLLATWGISLILIQTMRTLFGAQNVRVASPEWFSGSVQLMQGVSLSTSRVGVILFAIFVVALVWFLMQRTRLGLEVRAVMQNREMAAALGVSANRVDMWTFAAGAGVAGLGGVALSQIVNVGPQLGQAYIVDSFMVVVLGGVGNVMGSVVSALGMGVFSKFLEPVTGAVMAKILLFTAIILFIQWRPQGIFALKGRSADD